MRGFGAWIIPLFAVVGSFVGGFATKILNSRCDEPAELIQRCTRYEYQALGLVGAAVGAFLGLLIWGPWYDDARAAREDRPDDP